MNRTCNLSVFEQLEGLTIALVAVMIPVFTLAVLL
jgi:hypothetical protein